jgi:hypothetical protein
MANRQVSRTPPSMLAVGVILVLLSASGMLAGIVTHRLQDNTPATGPMAQATTAVGQPTSTPSAPVQPTATASSVTPSSGPGGSSQFTLSITASPKTVAPGQPIEITVTVVQKGTQAPLAGVQCFLRPPTGGGQSLLIQYPPAVTSNASGAASWSLTVPAQPPGTYRVETVAYGPHRYNYYSYTDVVVTG